MVRGSIAGVVPTGPWCAAPACTPHPGAARPSFSQLPGEGRGRFARQLGADAAHQARRLLSPVCHSEARPLGSSLAQVAAGPRNLLADGTWVGRGSDTGAGPGHHGRASGAWLRAPTIDPSACRDPDTPNAGRGRPQDDVVGCGAVGKPVAT